jgi:O-methyltransferase
MVTLAWRAARLANAALALFDAKLVAGNVTRWASDLRRPELRYQRVFPNATYSPWLSDEQFIRCYELIREYTLVDIYRCYELWTLARQLTAVRGDFLEVGVWRGGTGCLIAEAIRGSGKTVHLADTFSGVVKAGQFDPVYTGGEHADTSEETVRQLIRRAGLENAVTVKGVFPEETGGQVAGPIAFVHCDVDVYRSAKDVMEWAMSRLALGGVVVFDDYGFSNCEGVTMLVNELRRDSRFLFLHNLNGHAIFVRR